MTRIERKQVENIVENFVEKLVAGKIDFASARCDLRCALEKAGYEELGDERWLNGVLRLNTSLRQCWRQYNQGLHAATLDQWPAQELYRAFPRKEHRNWDGKESGDPNNPAEGRWIAAGGKLFNGRMIALMDDQIWYAISDFGFPFPPFAFNSGMGVRRIDRKTAQELELIDRDRQVSPKPVPRPNEILLLEELALADD